MPIMTENKTEETIAAWLNNSVKQIQPLRQAREGLPAGNTLPNIQPRNEPVFSNITKDQFQRCL